MRKKMKIFNFLLVVVLLNQCKKDEVTVVQISDNNFLTLLIKQGVDKDGDGKISYSEAAAIKSIKVSDKYISDLAGIESFINLDTLICSINTISTLDISKLTSLTYLDCQQNQLTSLNVSNNRKLIYSSAKIQLMIYN